MPCLRCLSCPSKYACSLLFWVKSPTPPWNRPLFSPLVSEHQILAQIHFHPAPGWCHLDGDSVFPPYLTSVGAGIVAQHTKLSPVMLAIPHGCQFQTQLLHFQSSSQFMCAGEQRRASTTTKETQRKFWVPAFTLAQPQPLQPFGEWGSR